MTLIQPHTDYAYLNNDGLIALSIGFNDANATVIRIPASGTIDPNQTYFPSAPDFVRILLYADGSIELYESNDQGSHMLLNYADIPALSLSYGHNAAYSSGPLVSFRYYLGIGLQDRPAFRCRAYDSLRLCL